MSIDFLNTDFEKVSYLSSLLTSYAIGENASDSEYKTLRYKLLSNKGITTLPSWLKIHRDLGSFWGFIQPKFGIYADRRKFQKHLIFLSLVTQLKLKNKQNQNQPLIKSSQL